MNVDDLLLFSTYSYPGTITLNVKFTLRKMNFTSERVVRMIVNKLRELREAKMAESDESEIWTQEGLAKRLGVTRQTIISMEKGTYNPSLTLAFKLANLFRVKIEDIFEFNCSSKCCSNRNDCVCDILDF